jgi:NADPH:quinone reductase
VKNQEYVLASRPKGTPTAENFRLIESDLPKLKDGEFLIRTLFVSVDPYMRGRMNDAKSYVPPFQIDQPISGGAIGQVIESMNPSFHVGDIISGTFNWALYFVSDGRGVHKVNPNLGPLTTNLGVLGMPGLTAYFGLLDIGKPKAGETVVVSGAAGAVGMAVGQIAKIHGCRVVGIAGSDEKLRILTEEMGFDAGINYKTASSLYTAIRETCPNGVDVYFDNVGGDVTDAVLPNLNDNARIPLCGQISLYNLDKVDVGPRNLSYVLIHRALIKGFIVSDYARQFGEAFPKLAEWVTSGQLKYRETVVEGFENIPNAFLGLFRGENIGKQLVKVADVQ